MRSVTHQFIYYDDGTMEEWRPKPNPLNPSPPPGTGWFLAQAVEDDVLYGQARDCAAEGCPSFILILDDPDTKFNKHWQLALYAWCFPMLKNNVASLMGDKKVLMNNTGIGEGRNKFNWISDKYPTVENPPEGYELPRLDKLRSFVRSTHWVRWYDNDRYQIWTMDGTRNPPMKPGTIRPMSAHDIENGKTKATDYIYNPYETLAAFMVCNNIRNKLGGVYSISPFDNGNFGLGWTPQPNEQYTFFPLVSEKEVVLVPQKFWKPVERIGNYYRRI